MINLIKNELFKIKIVKILISFGVFFTILLLFFKKGKNLYELSFNMIPIIGIFVCLFFGGTISSEIEKGTFRYYLTKPVSRHKIYVSKVLTSFFYCYISILIILIFLVIFLKKIDLFFTSKLLTYSIPLYFLSTFVIFLSSKLKSPSLAICLGLLVFCFSLLLTQVLLDMNLHLVKFTFLPYLDFTLFDDSENLDIINKSYNINLNLKSGVLIDIIYTLLFFIVGNISFIKKDIKS